MSNFKRIYIILIEMLLMYFEILGEVLLVYGQELNLKPLALDPISQPWLSQFS